MSTSDQVGWMVTTATVTTCRYQFARLNTLSLGVQNTSKFRITFDYYAHAQLYSSEFQSTVAIPQDEQLAVKYNPLDPSENSLSGAKEAPTRASLVTFGVAGSIVLSLLWFAVLRGCS